MKSISFDFVPKGKQKSDKMLFTNLLPDISCGGRTNLPTAKTTKISC